MKLLKTLEIAQNYGIASLAQLECFVRVAQSPGVGVSELVGRPASHPDYRAFLGIARKLMLSGYRHIDGLDLIGYGAPIADQPKGRELVLTPKGRQLWRKLQSLWPPD